jgi:hypothetical protein
VVSIGTNAAYFFSVAVTLWPSVFAATGAMPYYEASALLMTFLVLGRLLEARARGGTSEAIRRLIALRPKTARVVRAGTEVDLPIAEVLAGDLLDDERQHHVARVAVRPLAARRKLERGADDVRARRRSGAGAPSRVRSCDRYRCARKREWQVRGSQRTSSSIDHLCEYRLNKSRLNRLLLATYDPLTRSMLSFVRLRPLHDKKPSCSIPVMFR